MMQVNDILEDFDGMYISKSKSEQNVSAELIKQMNMKNLQLVNLMKEIAQKKINYQKKLELE